MLNKIICYFFHHREDKTFKKINAKFILIDIEYTIAMCSRCGVLYISKIK